MCFSFLLLGVESRDFSKAEKKRTADKAVQIQKMSTIFTRNDNLGHLEKNHVIQLPTAKN